VNELIQELARKTVEAVQHKPNGICDMNKYNQKFAELIVRECANHCDLLLDHKMSSEWSRGTHDCSKAIKKHFGVEE
jgi:hypothetical protein